MQKKTKYVSPLAEIDQLDSLRCLLGSFSTNIESWEDEEAIVLED